MNFKITHCSFLMISQILLYPLTLCKQFYSYIIMPRICYLYTINLLLEKKKIIIRKLENNPSPWDFAVFCRYLTENISAFQISHIVGFLSSRIHIVCNFIFYRYFILLLDQVKLKTSLISQFQRLPAFLNRF